MFFKLQIGASSDNFDIILNAQFLPINSIFFDQPNHLSGPLYGHAKFSFFFGTEFTSNRLQQKFKY